MVIQIIMVSLIILFPSIVQVPPKVAEGSGEAILQIEQEGAEGAGNEETPQLTIPSDEEKKDGEASAGESKDGSAKDGAAEKEDGPKFQFEEEKKK